MGWVLLWLFKKKKKKNLGYEFLSLSKFECNAYGARNSSDKFHRNNLKEIKTSWYDLYAA